ncbi:MAG: hypothetical protein JO089_08270 [Alphaproteobacteria bacterium]|nr:hypothetical protein [Alphaproteobacteria bacterium]
MVAFIPALAGCGFEPMYAKHDGADAPGLMAARVGVVASSNDPVQRRVAMQFAADLEDRLNPNGAAAGQEYQLKALIVVLESAVSISPDGTVARSNMNVSANLALIRLADGVTVYTGKTYRSVAYNNVANAYYSTYVAREDAIKRATTELAEDVRMRLAAYFAHPEAAAKPS